MPIYDSEPPCPYKLNLVESQALVPFPCLGLRFLYKWFWLRDEKH